MADDSRQIADTEGESDGIDLEHVRELIRFVGSSVRRRPKLCAFTFVTIAVLGLGVAATMPRLYSAEVKLLAQKGGAIRVLSSPHPQMDSLDNPTQNVAAMIERRDNLVALAKDANLVQRFAETRPPVLRFKDKMMARIFGPGSDESKLRAMVGTLEHQLTVDVGPDDSMTISVDWSNPNIAYDLVTLVQKNFLEARYDNDVAAIHDSIAVLEDHAKDELTQVDEALEAYQKLVSDRLVAERKAKAAALTTPTARPLVMISSPTSSGSAPVAVAEPDPEVTKALEEKRARIRALEENQQRTLDGIRQQLIQSQLTLTPQHPTVIALQQQLETLSRPPPELEQLKADERALMAQIVPPRPIAPIASAGAPGPSPLFAPRLTPAADGGTQEAVPLAPASPDRDGTLQLAESKLGAAISGYQDAMARIDAAKVELDITRAVYKHRYIVVTPAEVPAKPKKATAILVGFGSLIAALLVATGLAALLDFAAGVVLEPWQVRRRLKVEVLAIFENH